VQKLCEVCAALGGEIYRSNTTADLSVKLDFLPRFPVYIRLWMSDDEVRGSGVMLFDKQCLHYLGEMDLHICAPLISRYLIKHYAYLESAQ